MFLYRSLRYNYVMVTNKMHFSNECFNSVLPVFYMYMFRTSYVHHQEDYIVHAALYVILFMLKLEYKSI
jgi:hypothetical protein